MRFWGCPEGSNNENEDKLKEMNMRWLQDSLVEEEYRGKVYWATIEGITCAYFFEDAWKRLTLVGKKICPLGNLYVTYTQAVIVACVIRRIQLNVGALIEFEWNDFYRDNKKGSFLPRLLSALFICVKVSEDDTYRLAEMDPQSNNLLVRKLPFAKRERKKVGEAESSRAATVLGEEDM